MLEINGDIITLTRGDNATIEVDLINDNDETYEMQSGDRLTMTIRELPTIESPILLSVNSQYGSNRILLRPEDTIGMAVGLYSCDIQMVTQNHEVYTVYPTFDTVPRKKIKNYKNFDLRSEVTIP